MSWQDEVCSALDEWIKLTGRSRGGNRWSRVGSALPAAEPGVYVVDIRGMDLSADQVDNLRLAEREAEPATDGFRVRRISIEGEFPQHEQLSVLRRR